MQNIFSHIAYLLTKHECVVIPEFGALVHSATSSKNAANDDVFSPPCVSLGFNSELKHNDGLLCYSVKREQNISYNEANKIITDFSAELTDLLNKKREFTIPQVGRFIRTGDNKIIFSQASDISANAAQYGFKNFYMPLLSDIIVPAEKEEPQKDKDQRVIMIPLSKRLITAASVAAIALLFLLLSTPINNKDIPAQYAGMFSSYIPPAPEIVYLNPIENETIEKVEISDTIVSSRIEIPVETNESSNGYLIVIASLPNKNEAERMLLKIKKEFNSAAILEKDKRFRIYIHSFQDKKEAEYFLDKFRLENPKRKDAWLLSNYNQHC